MIKHDDASVGISVVTDVPGINESKVDRVERELAVRLAELTSARSEIDVLTAQIETYAEDFSRLYLEHNQEAGAPVAAELADARAQLEEASSRGRLYSVMYKKQETTATELATQLKHSNEQLESAQFAASSHAATKSAPSGPVSWWRRPLPFGLMSSGMGLLGGGLMYAQVLAPALSGGYPPTGTPTVRPGLGTPISSLAFVTSSDDARSRRLGQDSASSLASRAAGTVAPSGSLEALSTESDRSTIAARATGSAADPNASLNRTNTQAASATPVAQNSASAPSSSTQSVGRTLTRAGANGTTAESIERDDAAKVATVTALQAALNTLAASATVSAKSLDQIRATSTAAEAALVSARALATRFVPTTSTPTGVATSRASARTASVDDRCWFEFSVPDLPPRTGWMVRFTQSSRADILALWSSRIGGFALHAASPGQGVGAVLAGGSAESTMSSDVVLRDASPASYALIVRNPTDLTLVASYVGLFYGRGGDCLPAPFGVALASETVDTSTPVPALISPVPGFTAATSVATAVRAATSVATAARATTIVATPTPSTSGTRIATPPPPTWTSRPVVLLARPLLDCQPYLRLPSGVVEYRPNAWLDRDFSRRGSVRVSATLRRPNDQLVDEYDLSPDSPAHSFALDRPGVHRLDVTAVGADTDANCSVPFVYEGVGR